MDTELPDLHQRPVETTGRRLTLGLFGQFDESLHTYLQGHDLVVQTTLGGPPLATLIGSLDGIIIRSPFALSDECARQATRLRWVVRAGSGTDNLSPLLAERGVIVRSTPITAHSVAELVLGLVLGLLRHLRPAHASLARGEWKKQAYVGGELRGRTVGLLGYGRIGREIARLLSVLGVNLVAFDRSPGSADKQSAAAATGTQLCASVDEVLVSADIVVSCLPGSAETRDLIDRRRLGLMRRGALLVNVGRGSLLDLAALTEALESGHLGGAALDVFPSEPPGRLRLFELENVLCTPHLGAQTREAHTMVAAGVIRHFEELNRA
jgi:D-3-phosphoglycerate dehydrogenase